MNPPINVVWDDKNEDDKRVIIMCRRSERIDRPAGSILVDGDCGHSLWAAGSSVAAAHILDDRGDMPLYYCLPCGIRSAKENGAFSPDVEFIKKMRMDGELTEDEVDDIEEAMKS